MIKRLLVTGYKASELNVFNDKHPGIKYIKLAIERDIRNLIDSDSLEWIITSGQLGVEMWTCELVLELKNEFPQLKLAIITPFLEQEKNWNELKQEHYHQITSQADYVNSITSKIYEGPWQFRLKNTFLLDHSDAMLIIYDEDKDGSPKYIRDEAQKRVENDNYSLFNINSYDLQLIVEEEQRDIYDE